jgi:TPR repeat protein
VLAYLCLLPGPDGTRDVTRAIELCRRYADAGDAYARFVLAWALLFGGQRIPALKLMKKAALSGFPPAALDLVTFVWNGWGTKERYPSTALELLERAERTEHKAALVWRCRLYMSGQFGLLLRLAGYATLPVALLRYALAVRRDPYSSKVFLFPIWVRDPVIRPEDSDRSSRANPETEERQGGTV